MKIEVVKNEIQVSFPFNHDLVEKTKSAGMKWRPGGKLWWCPDNIVNRQVINDEFETDLHIDSVEPLNTHNPYKHLMDHQLLGVATAVINKRHGYFFDTGTGKTLTAIEIIKMYFVKTLIVCPLSIIEPAWVEDLSKFAPELLPRTANLWKLKKLHPKNINRALEDMQICIVNFESFKSLKGKIEQAGFQMCIIDESSKCKTNTSGITKALIEFTDNIPCVYLLSGTPAPNSKLEYWSQVRMLDKTLLGTSFYAFRNKYYQSCGYGGYQWIEKSEMQSELMEKIASVSTVVRKEDVLDLPDRTFQERHIQLSPAEKAAYNDMSKHMLAEIEDQEITAYNAAVKIMKLRQVTAGFLFDEEKQIHTFGDSKLKGLMELLEEIGDHQVLIWTQFQYEASQLLNKLGAWKETAVCNGTVLQSAKEANVRQFKEGHVKYLIAHPRTLGHGVTLTNCNYAIYYSLSYSHEEHYQSRDRIYRKGQENHCTYYYLIVPKTIDSVIYKALQKKENIAEGALNYIKNLGRLK